MQANWPCLRLHVCMYATQPSAKPSLQVIGIPDLRHISYEACLLCDSSTQSQSAGDVKYLVLLIDIHTHQIETGRRFEEPVESDGRQSYLGRGHVYRAHVRWHRSPSQYLLVP